MQFVNQVMTVIDRFAPWGLAEDWDRVGLQVGRRDQPVSRIMVALDLNRQVLAEGLSRKVDCFLVHHPLIFKPLTTIDQSSTVGYLLSQLITNHQALIVAHTNVDKAAAGLNDYLAKQIDLKDSEPLQTKLETGRYYKVVVFAPEVELDRLRQAMTVAGAGEIGNYTECSFGLNGYGTFRPNNQAKPWVGSQAQLNSVAEIRLEMLAPQCDLSKIIKTIKANHPYEEPAFDIYPLEVFSEMGKVGNLTEPILLSGFCQSLKDKLGLTSLRVCGDLAKPIRRLAVCSGSGGSLVGAALSQGADAFLSGDFGYHDYLLARDNGLALIDGGHWGTEQGFGKLMSDYLKTYFPTESGLDIITCNTIQQEPYLSL